jgi:hypothetical protein
MRGRSAGVAGGVPGAVPVTALSLDPGAVEVPGPVVWARAHPVLMASIRPAIASFMKELLLLFSRSQLADAEYVPMRDLTAERLGVSVMFLTHRALVSAKELNRTI